MKLFTWRSTDITTRLVMIAVMPATLMFLVISTALYFSNQDEIRRDIEERGNVLAAALAENSLYAVVWTIDDPKIVSVVPEYDGKRLRIDAANQGETIVHVNSHGETFDIPVRVGPPALVYIWIEPSTVMTNVGAQVHVKASGLDTMYRVQDVTLDSYWAVRDERIANLDMAGMMLQAMSEGHTTLHANFGDLATITDVTILK